MVEDTMKITKIISSLARLLTLLSISIQFSFSSTVEAENNQNPSFKAFFFYQGCMLDSTFSSYTDYVNACMPMFLAKSTSEVAPFLIVLEKIFNSSEKHFFFKILNEHQFYFGYLNSYPPKESCLHQWCRKIEKESESMFLADDTSQKKIKNGITYTEKGLFTICDRKSKDELIKILQLLLPGVGIGDEIKNKFFVESALKKIIILLNEAFYDFNPNNSVQSKNNFYV